MVIGEDGHSVQYKPVRDEVKQEFAHFHQYSAVFFLKGLSTVFPIRKQSPSPLIKL